MEELELKSKLTSIQRGLGKMAEMLARKACTDENLELTRSSILTKINDLQEYIKGEVYYLK